DHVSHQPMRCLPQQLAARVALMQQFRAFYYQTVSMDRILAPLLLLCLCSAARSTKRVPDWLSHAGSWRRKRRGLKAAVADSQDSIPRISYPPGAPEFSPSVRGSFVSCSTACVCRQSLWAASSASIPDCFHHVTSSLDRWTS